MAQTIRYTLDAGELPQINLAITRLGGKGRESTTRILLALNIFTLLSWIVFWLSPELDIWTLITVSGLALLLPLLFLYQTVYLPRHGRGKSESQKTHRVEYTLTLTDERLVLEHTYGSARLPWNVFIGWNEDEEYLFLFQNENFANFVPKRYLDPEALEFLHRKIEDNRIPTHSPRSYLLPPALTAIGLIILFIAMMSYGIFTLIQSAQFAGS